MADTERWWERGAGRIALDAEFSETDHPRDAGGRFGSGSGAAKASGIKEEHATADHPTHTEFSKHYTGVKDSAHLKSLAKGGFVKGEMQQRFGKEGRHDVTMSIYPHTHPDGHEAVLVHKRVAPSGAYNGYSSGHVYGKIMK